MSINLKTNCDAAVGNFGIKGCQIPVGELSIPVLVDPSVKLNIETDTLDKEFWDNLIAQNKVKMLPEGVFTSTAEENVRSTVGSSGISKPVRDGLFSGTFSFCDGGVCFANALSTLKYKKWALFFIDSSAVLIAGKSTDGFLLPFKTSFVDKGTTTFNDGATFSQYTLDFQLNKGGNKLWNTVVTRVEPVDFDFFEIGGVNDVALNITVDAGVGVTIEAVIDCDGTEVVPNLETSFWLTDVATGVGEFATVTFDSVTGFYSAGVLAAGSYTIEVRDANGYANVQDVAGCWYNSETVSFVVV